MTRRYVFLALGERIELWADFSDSPVGDDTAIVSLLFNVSEGGGGMGRGMMMGRRKPFKPLLDLGANFSICHIKVTKRGEKKPAAAEKFDRRNPPPAD